MLYFIFYNTLIIGLYKLTSPILRLFLPKLNKRIKESVRVFESIIFEKKENDKIIWFHSASMGEFEQAKPIIEKLKKESKNLKIISTFYSPSGYDNQKNYIYSDVVLYLPDDSLANVSNFLDKFKPDLAVFVRYDTWYNYLRECKNRKIPCYLIAATRPGSKRIADLTISKKFANNYFSFFDKIFTIDKTHSDYFRSLKIPAEIITSSDPRFDRINQVVNDSMSVSLFPPDLFDEFVLVVGSSWQKDESIIIPAIEKINSINFSVRCILVPHEPTKEHVSELISKCSCVSLSEILLRINGNISIIDLKKWLKKRHIVVDSIGHLLKIYSYANAAFIGGGFGAGVHSVTEPAGYGLPLASGPNIARSYDALELNRISALTIVRDKEQAYNWLENILTSVIGEGQSRLSRDYIQSKLGTTDKIVNEIINQLN